MPENMESSGFRLDPQTLNEVLDLLDACFSPQKAMLPDFQQKLAHMETLHNNVEFNFYVLYILSGGRTTTSGNSGPVTLNNQIPVHIRIAAGLLIKNNIRKLYKNFPQSLIHYMRQNLLPLLADNELQICKTTANIISFLALESGYDWPDLLPTLFNMIDPKNENSMQAIFVTLSNICEDIAMNLNVNTLTPNSPHMQLLLFIIDKLLAIIQNLQLPTYQAVALGCINNFLADMSEHIVRRPIGFLNLLFSLAQHNDQLIKRNVCQAFHTLVMVSDLLDPHLLNIFEYMLQRLTKPHEEYDVALEATDFWQTIVEDELHNDHLFNLLPRLVPLLIVNLRLSNQDFLTSDINADGSCKENNENELHTNIKPIFRKNKSATNDSTNEEPCSSNDYTWTLSIFDLVGDLFSRTIGKVSASTLDKLAVIFHGHILPIVFTSLEPLMRQNDDWVIEESVNLVFGAIADGCIKEMAQYLDQTIPFFVRCLNSPKSIIRSTAIWTVGRYAHWLTDPARKNYLEVILRAILERALDPSSKVQGSALVSIAILAEESRENFSPYIPYISQILVHCANSCKGQTMIALYDVLAALFDSVESTTEDPIMKSQIIPWIVERWHQQTRSLHRETLPLMDCFCSLIVAMKYNFEPYLELSLKNCFDIIQYSLNAIANGEISEDEDKDFMILALDTISTIVERLPKVAPAIMKIFNVVPLLPLVAQDDCLSVKQSLYSLVGELARHSFDLLDPIVEELIKIIADEITAESEIFPRDKEHFNVYNNAIWAFGEIIFRANPKQCYNYISQLLPKLLNYVGAVHFIPVLRENSVICICYFGLHWPGEVSTGIAPNLGDICACITEIASTEEKKLCLISLAHMGRYCPAVVSNNFVDVIKAFISWNAAEVDSRLSDSVNALFSAIKNSVNNERWNNFWVSALDNNTKQMLNVKYGISN